MARACVENSQNLCKEDRRFFLTTIKHFTGSVAVLREQYLREDLSCRSPWCRVCAGSGGMQRAA